MTAIETVEALDEMRFAAARKEANEFVSGADLKNVALKAIVRAIRQADERAGLVTVPREPTGDMLNAFSEAVHFWMGENGEDADVLKAICAASPFASAAQGEGK